MRHILCENMPHFLGISEANLNQDVDPFLIQVEGYKLLTLMALQKPTLRISRLVVFNRMDELESVEEADHSEKKKQATIDSR